MDDRLIIENIKNGDKKAFNLLFTRYYRPLVAYIVPFTNDVQEAENLVQDTFVSLWEKNNKLGDIRYPKSYLYTTTYNNFIDHYRKLKKRDLFFEDLRESIQRELITDNQELLDSKINRLKKLIKKLPPKCREILELNKLRGLKYKEIAERLDISEKTVEAQMAIAFKKIRKGFESNDLILVLAFNDI